MPDDLIKKSIRLPADLDEYVNSQKGTTWTDKLCRILEDYRSGDETRAEYMADYEKRMAANRKKIQEQNSQIYTVARSLDHLHRALEDLNSLPFTCIYCISFWGDNAGMRCTCDGCIRLRYPCRCSGGALHNNLPFLTVFALR